MKNIKLLKIEIENFKGITQKVISFNERTTIKGMNGIGKSTVYDSLLWVLFDKLASGISATDIRPHDENGKDIDFVEINVAATFEVNGREITLKKTQKQNWVKDRATQEQTFKGNDNLFEVNGIPKKLKEYKEYIAENFCPEEIFLMCTNAMAFFKLDTKKRRAKLMELVQEVTNADVIDTDTKFIPLADMLSDGTVEELVTRSKGIIKKLNEQLKLIPARIDEQNHSKVDIDVAELELQKNSIKEKIADLDSKIADVSKQYEEFENASNGILELKFKLSDLERSANEENIKKRNELSYAIYEKMKKIEDCKIQISQKQQLIEMGEEKVFDLQKKGHTQVDKWNVAKGRIFDTDSLVCTYCGQSYPLEKQAQLKAEFESHKAEELAEIERVGKKIVSEQKEINLKNIEYKKEIESLKEKQTETEQEVVKFNEEMAKIPETVDMSETKEYINISNSIKEKEELLKNGTSASDLKEKLYLDRKKFEEELSDVEIHIGKAYKNVEIDERISELQSEQRTVAQKIADEESILDLLERFNKKKMEMLTESVNKHFSIVKWRLFSENINGGYSDVCQAVVNGSNYETCLNTGHKILADIDILRTFQTINETKLPIFIDNAEALNDFNVPEVDGQMILLKVSEDKEMVVE